MKSAYKITPGKSWECPICCAHKDPSSYLEKYWDFTVVHTCPECGTMMVITGGVIEINEDTRLRPTREDR